MTEFSVFNLKGATAQYAELVAAGKPPEEIEQTMGEAHKLEGDKLKHFVRSLQASDGKIDGLKRVLVVTFAEGERVPPAAQKIEEHYYMLEGFVSPKKAQPADERGGRGGRGGGKGGRGGPGGGKGRGPGGSGGGGGGRGPGGSSASGPGAGGSAPGAKPKAP